ncbi:MAG: hypothetical protein ABSD70_06960 [Terracidiphilus sp.]|jgi:hypothetical protein
MEIAPIPGIRALGPVRVRPAASQAPAIFDIDRSEKPGDQIVQRSGRKGAGAEEDAEDEIAGEIEAGEEETPKSVSYFA